VDKRQGLPDGTGQLFGKWCWQHSGQYAHEQIVAELTAQLGKGVADGRLDLTQFLRHLGDATFGHQMLEEQKLIEIDVLEFRVISSPKVIR
jgi:hypothetical protein